MVSKICWKAVLVLAWASCLEYWQPLSACKSHNVSMTIISITNSKTEQPKLFIRYHIPSGLPTTSNALMTDLNIHCHLKPRCLSSKDVFPFSFRMMGVPAPPWTGKTPCTGSFLGWARKPTPGRPGQEHMEIKGTSIKVTEFLSVFSVATPLFGHGQHLWAFKAVLGSRETPRLWATISPKEADLKHREICSIFRPSKSCVVFDFKQNAFLLLHTGLFGNWFYIHCWTCYDVTMHWHHVTCNFFLGDLWGYSTKT